MRTCATALVLFVILVVVGAGSLPCNENLRTRVQPWHLLSNGTLLDVQLGHLYPEGTFWTDEDVAWACPCMLGNCIRICSQDLANSTGEQYELTLDKQNSINSTIQLWQGDEHREYKIGEAFRLIKEAKCTQNPFMLLPEEDEVDEYQILLNGSLFFTSPKNSETHRILGAEGFCIITTEEDVRVLACPADAEDDVDDLKFKIYPAFFILSAFFLLLTLIAFFLSPDFNNLHGRSMACQAGSLLIMYVGMTIIYLTGGTVHISICVATAVINYYFLLASFLWLNVMCIDIYFTFRGTIALRPEINFLYPSLFAWGIPALLVVVVLILDNTTDDKTFSPGIGTHSCWFQGFWSELLYFDGPVIVLLVANVALFGATARRLWRLKREAARVFKRSSTCVVAPSGNRQHKDRFTLYVKLFLLMGVTWIMEVVSWAVGGPDTVWFLTDSVNCLRGVLIFWFSVWSNKAVHKVFVDAFCSCCRRRSNVHRDYLRSSKEASHGSSLSTSSSAL